MKINVKYILLQLLFASCFFILNVGANNNVLYQTGQENHSQLSPDSPSESLLQKTEFTTLEIKYFAPQSKTVYLAWYPEKYERQEALNWNKNTKLTDKILYTPLLSEKDTFYIHLNVPKDAIINYFFWITKNTSGEYLDFWDLSSSGQIDISVSESVFKEANYTAVKEKKTFDTTDKGWLVLLLLMVFFPVVYFIRKKAPTFKPGKIELVVFTGLGLALFHALARSSIIGLNPMNIASNYSVLFQIIKASWSDFLYVFILTAVFVLLMSVFKNATIQKCFFYIFVVIASFSLVYAFANITIVVFLEKPLNYQWLYYSDFLGSEEAKNAMQANLSVTTIFNLLFYVLSLFLLSAILLNIYHWVISKKYLKQTTLVFIILMVGVLGFKSYRAAANWTKGQEENAVAAMLKSIVKSDSDASFYSISVPENMLPFETAFEKNENTPFYTDTNHNVKNVLFIVLESAGAVYFDEYGGQYNLSSNLNRLAERSLIIENMYAHAPSTNRSLVSILGSVYPELTYKSITQELPDIEMPTISSVLKSKGYRTSFFSSANLNFQNCNEFLKYRDFDIVEDFSTIDCSEQFTMKNEDYKESNGIDDLCLADCLNSWLEEDTSGNFFSVLWTVQGHYPYFFNGTEEDFGVSDINFNRYLNALKHNDELVNKVMQNLEQKGLDSSTLVVVVGDHGEAFGQHGQFGHATALYEENVKVPLYFINPELFSGERKNDIAGMKDLATTALAIINIETPKTWQGRNLLSTSSDENFYFAPWSDYLFAYRKANKKFIFNETRNTVEVYDLDKDKKEKNNIYTTTPETEIDYARKRLAAWLQSDHAFVQN